MGSIRFFYETFFVVGGSPASQLGQESANAGPHLLAMMELPEGTTLRSDTYRLERVLGQGGFGITYFGQEMALQRPVAIKEHFPYGSTRDGLAVGHGILTAEEYHASLQRFARESRLLAQFDHPSIVHVLTVFEEAHTSYLVMEYVAGLSLEQLLTDQGKIEPERAAGYVGQACQALQIVHERGLLHRDIKPSNLLLRPEGRLVVIDFGSAREADLRKATAIVSAGYSPPELYSQGGVFGPRTDIYALGATLYHLITGQPPLDCLQRLMGETLQPFDDPRLWVVAERALRMDPQERFASMAEFLSALAPPGITQVIPSPSLPVLAPPSVEAVPAVPAGWGASGVATLVGHRGWIRALAFSPDGKFLASGSEDKSVRIWSEDGQLVTTLTGHTGWVYGLLFSEDGSVLYTAGYDRQLLAWNTASWQRVAQERCCEAIQCLSGWGVWLAVGTLSGKLELRRLPQLTLLRTLKLPGAVTSCAFAQGNLAATAGDDRIYLIDIEQGVVLERLKGHQGTVRVLQVLNDGRLISGGADRAVRIWDLDHGQSLPWSGGHQGTVLALIPIAGGLVSASGDKSVRIWNLNGDSRELGRHHGEVSALAATGDWVASGGQDNVVRLWPGRPP